MSSLILVKLDLCPVVKRRTCSETLYLCAS